jgi:RNA polymerase sigma-70 factor (ECF subfamily)
MAADRRGARILPGRAAEGDPQSWNQLFDSYRERLERMIRLRLDRRLHARVDAAAIVEEARASIFERKSEYLASPAMPLFLWMRQVTGQRLQAVHAEHLGAAAGAGAQDVSLYRGALPEANSVSLAALLLGRFVSPGEEAERAERQIRLQEALNSMDQPDREILALRHFEELDTSDAAIILGISRTEASHAYVRALKRLKDVLSRVPGFFERGGP